MTDLQNLTAAQLDTHDTITKREPVYSALFLIDRLATDPANHPTLAAVRDTEKAGRNNPDIIGRINHILSQS